MGETRQGGPSTDAEPGARNCTVNSISCTGHRVFLLMSAQFYWTQIEADNSMQGHHHDDDDDDDEVDPDLF